MSDFERPLSPREQFESARSQLEQATDNVELIEYAMGRGPLMRVSIPSSRWNAVQPVVGQYGWPEPQDSSIAPVLNYTDNEFIKQLFSDKTRSEDPKVLNNFRLFLRALPIKDMDEVDGVEDVYGLMPVVHRAHALAPEFFTALRTSIRAFPLEESDFAENQLLQDKNADIRTAYHMGYRIMGRLLKEGDASTPIRDAHQALTD